SFHAPPSPELSTLSLHDALPIFAGARAGRPFVALGFDPRNSDWVLRVAWPLFVLNTINAFVEEDTSYVSSFRTGEVWRIPAPSRSEEHTSELQSRGHLVCRLLLE